MQTTHKPFGGNIIRGCGEATVRRTRTGEQPARHKRLHRCAGMVLAALFATGCGPHTQSEAVDVDAGMWNAPAVIELANTDTVTLRDLRLFIRCNERFTADSLPLQVMVLSPDSLRYEEHVTLRPVPGRHPAALNRVCEWPYRTRVRLTDTGDYRVVIRPVTPQQGIEAMGINIVKTQ